MKIEITCTVAEQTQIKRSIKVNAADTEIIYKPIKLKPEGVTHGEYILSMIEWRTEEDDG